MLTMIVVTFKICASIRHRQHIFSKHHAPFRRRVDGIGINTKGERIVGLAREISADPGACNVLHDNQAACGLKPFNKRCEPMAI